ncbi:hypothetical protein VNO80_15440 [Phaseolus coccineus]|uniref:Pentatricopeptide repeat-containing protein n=1 Tax=Phaseolus coccineus TaxID=3886 RepID=A0AAN9MK98_PHACN
MVSLIFLLIRVQSKRHAFRDGAQPNEFTIAADLQGFESSFMWPISSCFGHIGVQGSSIYIDIDNTLMDMYTICCDTMDQAKMIFEDFTTKTDVCWTTLTTGYTHKGDAYGGLKSFLSNVSVKEAYQLIESMPLEPDKSIWAVLLGACKLHNQPSVAKLAALRALDMKPIRTGTYALISNIYATEGI